VLLLLLLLPRAATPSMPRSGPRRSMKSYLVAAEWIRTSLAAFKRLGSDRSLIVLL
jgi:hypothetical protein